MPRFGLPAALVWAATLWVCIATASLAPADDPSSSTATDQAESAAEADDPTNDAVAYDPSSPATTGSSDVGPDAEEAGDAGRSRTRIDAATAALVGPVERCSDAEFLRRAYLDLAGVIPTADEVRAFLADERPNKREALIDRLLDDPRFPRRMADVLDAMLMERRPNQHVPQADWHEFLRGAVADRVPLDELCRTILGADGAEPNPRGPARFYLDRQVEPHVLTRDLGRIFFGRDLQCAQCHDHPLIDGYLQREYHGLLAFVLRSHAFEDKEKKLTVVAEKAEGEAQFKSVFDESAQGTARPTLPGGLPIAEPQLPDDERYLVKPDKNVRPVPRISRRQLLAEAATSGRVEAFNRNFANRLWALVMGRGLVEPLDLLHEDNPPIDDELLALLAEQLAQREFDLRWLLRELATSETYQRRLDPPDNLPARRSQLEASLAAARQALEALESERPRFEEQIAAAGKSLSQARQAASQLAPKRQAAADALAAAKALAAEAEASLSELRGLHDTLAAATAAVRTAAEQALAAAALVPDDSELAQAAKTIQSRGEQLASQLAEAAAAVESQQQAARAAAEALIAAQGELAALDEQVAEAGRQLDTAELQRHEAAQTGVAGQRRRNACQARIERIEKLLAAMDVLGSQSDSAQHAAAWQQAGGLLADQFVIAALRPLSPEQLGWSIMQATGVRERERSAIESELAQQAPLTEDADEAARGQRREQIEAKLREKLGGQLGDFVRLFSAGAGQPEAEFFATVDQALFLSNGQQITTWLAPTGGQLVERLTQTDDPGRLAEDLYLSVLSRLPSEEEVAEVRHYLAQRGDQRASAIAELAWSLLTSAEFRFQH